ncbi:MAG: hypothetical protein QNJ31_05225 [Candidatus Caenarcaniphilales bacterium]|nr:hypothetical protein [Candidatus Caenarcaniphilales bacterium]
MKEWVNKVDKLFESLKPDPVLVNFLQSVAIKAPEVWISEFEKREYFDPEKNPEPKEDEKNKGFYSFPDWRVMTLLLAAARKLKHLDKENKFYEKSLDSIIKILDGIIEFELKRDTSEKQLHTNLRTNKILIECISYLPPEKIELKYIDFCISIIKWPYWGSNSYSYSIQRFLLPSLIQNSLKQPTLKLFKECILQHREDNGYILPYLKNYWLHEYFKNNKEKLFPMCGKELSEHIVEQIKSFPDKDVSLSSIEDSDQNTGVSEYENQLVFCLREYIEWLEPIEAKPLIEDWLNIEKHQSTSVLFRIAIHGINKHYSELKNLFWNLEFNPLQPELEAKESQSTYNYDLLAPHEVWMLLSDNASKINIDTEASRKLLAWIKNLNFDFRDGVAENDKKISIASRIKWWLYPFKDLTGEITKKYKEQNTICSEEPGHPGWWRYFWTVTEEDRKKDSFVDYSQFDFKETLEAYKKKFNYYSSSDFRRGDVSDFFSQHVAENPQKFLDNIEELKKTPEWFVDDSLIVGFHKAYLNKSLNVQELEKIFSYFIHRVNLLVDQDEKEVRTSRIIDFLRAGIVCEENEFVKQLENAVSELLIKMQFVLLEKDFSLSQSSSYVDNSINSTKGKFAEALIIFGLKNTNFKNDLFHILSDVFDKKPSTNVNAILGLYLANLWISGSAWVKKQIQNIFPDSDSEEDLNLFNASFQGYVGHINYIYQPEDLFEFLRDKEIFLKALRNGISKGIASNYEARLIDHIFIGYIENREILDNSDSLLNLVLKEKKVEQLKELIHYAWRSLKNDQQDKYENDKLPDQKIQNLWKKLIEICEESPELKKDLLPYLGLWICLVKDTNGVKELILNSTKYLVGVDRDSLFIEYLYKHSKEKFKAKTSGEIFIELLNNTDHLPAYKEENIKGLVKNLYDYGEKDLADRICNKYANSGFMFLKETYSEGNSAA